MISFLNIEHCDLRAYLEYWSFQFRDSPSPIGCQKKLISTLLAYLNKIESTFKGTNQQAFSLESNNYQKCKQWAKSNKNLMHNCWEVLSRWAFLSFMLNTPYLKLDKPLHKLLYLGTFKILITLRSMSQYLKLKKPKNQAIIAQIHN